MPKWILLGFIVRIDNFKKKKSLCEWKLKSLRISKHKNEEGKDMEKKKRKEKEKQHMLVQKEKKEEGKYLLKKKKTKTDFEACDIEVSHR